MALTASLPGKPLGKPSGSWIERLRSAGSLPGDSDEVRLQKRLLLFAMGLTTLAPILWSLLYKFAGMPMSSALPFGYQLVSLATLLIYLATGNFDLFRAAQQVLFLFFPFVLQWSMGSVVAASGVALWALMAPVSAVLLYSVRESIPWFVAYVILVVASAAADYYDPATLVATPSQLRASALFFSVHFVAVSSLVYFLLRFAAIEREKSQSRADEALELLRLEQEKSELLLLNILPAPIAERLKRDTGTIADGFAEVTVMFADIVNFTPTVEHMEPANIFAMLNKVFSAFDKLAEKHGLEKIKTIGDAYMVAGGLNSQSATGYAQAIARMALDMRELMANDREVNDKGLQIRMGIGTGPVVAGVVGTKKFIYDLWGDTVNLASRITSDGVPDVIQVDATTHERLGSAFTFEAPRRVVLKGKGETVIYRLTGTNPG